MNKTTKCSPEIRERAVRLVQENRSEYPSLWAAVESIAPEIGCVPQTLLDWVQREEVDHGQRERSSGCALVVIRVMAYELPEAGQAQARGEGRPIQYRTTLESKKPNR